MSTNLSTPEEVAAMRAATPHCPVTRSAAVVPLGTANGYDIWRCPASATDFIWPIPSDTELKRYYDRREWFKGGERGGYADYDRQTESSLPMVAGLLDRFPADETVRYVLDFGCGYGSHLALAADRGWKCFGVEISDHARQTAIERHGDRMFIVEQVEALIPHEFDLVLMLDVLEHVGDPYALLFGLFNRGLLGPKTRVVIATPNARSNDAVRDLERWIYRHPPSHLVYYSARSLHLLMKTLKFRDVRVYGASPLQGSEHTRFADEDLSADEALTDQAGLVCEAEGSDFFNFMHERYVPGTWSKLAEYEHMPRYQFARLFARGAQVLDFGCGTGYGSRALADEAADVIGLDIDADALEWATFWHQTPGLRFERHADLGASLPSESFDIVTCFEMIEHVDHVTQMATIESIARVVKPTGKLLISTPNPAVTANYGVNPYHLREMSEAEFVALLTPHFAHVVIFRQWIRPSIMIGSDPLPPGSILISDRLSSERVVEEPPAFIAVCSHQPIDALKPFCAFDGSFDMVLAETHLQKTLTTLRFESYQLREGRDQAVREAVALQARLSTIAARHNAFDEQARNIDELRKSLEATTRSAEAAAQAQAETIGQLHASFADQETNIDGLRQEIAARTDALLATEIIAAERAEHVAAQRAALEEQSETIAGMRASFADQEASIDGLRQEVVAKTDAHAAAERIASEQAQQIAAQQAALDEQTKTIAGMRASFAIQEANIGAMRQEIASAIAAHNLAGSTATEQAEQIGKLRTALETLAETIARIRAESAEQEVNIDGLRDALAARQQVIDVQAGTISTSASVIERQAAGLDQQDLVILEMRQKISVQEQHIAKMVTDFTMQSHNIDQLRATLRAREETIGSHNRDRAGASQEIAAIQIRLEEGEQALARQRAQTAAVEALLQQRTAEKEEWARHYAALEHTRFVRLARILHGKSGSRAPVVEGLYLVAGGLIPGRLKSKLAPVAASLRGRFTKRNVESDVFVPYVIKRPLRIRASRPRVLHVIANFMTGGSSRLVVDLLEHLGGEYEQHILTSFIPSPVNYVGADITEVRSFGDTDAMRAAIDRFKPHIVHVHYWGDVDEPWYRSVFDIVQEHGYPIVQNINTPVAPFTDVKRMRNVFVSRYVLEHFGDGQPHNTVIYPGSDFTLFAPSRRPRRAHGCIGMVYRLERDKLDELAIEPFIEAAINMPGLKCLIVGGGSLMQPFKDRVRAEGLDDAFEFTGYVSYESLPALYRRMDVFVAPIWKESFGQVSAFAMNMGIPVIGYDVGAIPEIVADPSLVATARDSRTLAAIAVGLVRDDDARASIGVANRKRAARMFSVHAMIGSYRELYRDLMKQ